MHALFKLSFLLRRNTTRSAVLRDHTGFFFFLGRHRIIFRDNLADENVLECHIRYRDHHQQGKRKSTKST